MEDTPEIRSRFSLTREKQRSEKALREALAIADDYDFTQMIWAADALKRGQNVVGPFFVSSTPEIVSFAKSESVNEKWTLEALYNRFLATPSWTPKSNRRLKCRALLAIVHLDSLQKALENAHDGLVLSHSNIQNEIHRIAQRQFPWQRGYQNIGQIYRSSFMYAFEDAQTVFQASYGFSLGDFCKVAFAAFVVTQTRPGFSHDYIPNQHLGVSDADTQSILKLLSSTIIEGRHAAANPKWRFSHPAYTWSALRERPMIEFPKQKTFLAPIPELIMHRITEGLYYDIVGKTSRISNEIGRRFEEYTREMLTIQLPDLTVEPEFTFNNLQNLSPDVFVKHNERVYLAIECKAKKMPIGAKFGEVSNILLEPGIRELAAGVLQIWRYFAFMEKGVTGNGVVDDDAIGMLLLLDPWADLSTLMYEEIFRQARILASKEKTPLSDTAMRQVVIASVQDLEYVLERCSGESFLSMLKVASTKDREAWHLGSVHDQLPNAPSERKTFPFKQRVAQLAPWWTSFDNGQGNDLS